MVQSKHFPATLVVFPEGCNARRAAFYLAAEEYLAEIIQKCNTGCYLFTWILAPTVVFGRNQVLTNEINLEFCRNHNIDVVRRKSGGGAIYADGGNMSYRRMYDGGMSGHDIRPQLERMLEEADSERERRAIEEALQKM